MGLQVCFCCAVIVLCDSVTAQAAALTWMMIGAPCMFGFLLPTDKEQ
jgi:hypothetical protein